MLLKGDRCGGQSQKYVFKSHHGLFRCTKMSFSQKMPPGLSNARMLPYYPQINGSLELYIKKISSYFQCTRRSNRPHALIFCLIEQPWVTLKLKRWTFSTNCVDFLSHVIKPSHLQVSSGTRGRNHTLLSPLLWHFWFMLFSWLV